jgi:hypothetical protein
MENGDEEESIPSREREDAIADVKGDWVAFATKT